MQWQMLEMIDPWGQYREDLRVAKAVCDVARLLGAKHSVTGEPVQPKDFLIDFTPAPPVPEQPKPGKTWTKARYVQSVICDWTSGANAIWRKKQGRSGRG